MNKSLVLAGLLLLGACADVSVQKGAGGDLKPLAFTDLKGWGDDKVHEAFPAFLKSCQALRKKKPDSTFVLARAGKAADWQKLCEQARSVNAVDPVATRAFFEENFIPFAAQDEGPNLFTGYYEASLKGALKKGGVYQTPLWGRPKDMIIAELGIFKPALKGQRIAGKVTGQKLVPYDKRADIAKGSLKGRAKPVAWVNSPVDAFFLEIQGSGRVSLPDGGQMCIGYAAQNGHEYVAIGRVLADRGLIERPVTMDKIREWLAANPKRAQKIMNENPSYVFFRKIEGEGPIGAQGVALTPMRSLAVDPSFVPLGVPLWLETEKHNKLVVAQDTGGAIKGAVRGDLFWGHGDQAQGGAGEMQERGTYYLLLPKNVE